MFGAEGRIRPLTPYGAPPSRWCVCQFRHFRTEVQSFDSNLRGHHEQARVTREFYFKLKLKVFATRDLNYLFVGGGVVGGVTGSGAGFAGAGADDAGLPNLSNTEWLATVFS